MPTSSRVIHARIDIETLISVCEFFESQGGRVTDPLSTKVSLTLAQLMRHLRESDQVPTHQPYELEHRFSELTSEPTLKGQVDLAGVSFKSNPTLTEEEAAILAGDLDESPLVEFKQDANQDPRARLRELIDATLDQVTQPKIELDPDVWAPDPNDLPDPGNFEIDFNRQLKLAISDLPTDREEVLRFLALDPGSERDIQALIAQVIFALDQEITPEQYKKLAVQLRPHAEAYITQIVERGND